MARLYRPVAPPLAQQLYRQQARPAGFQEIARAIKKAAVAASPPMSTVWIALRRGAVPVKRLLIYPKNARARRVAIADTVNAVLAVDKSIYGPSGIKPPTIYAPAIVAALIMARLEAGFSSPNSNRIIKSPHASGRFRRASTIGWLSSSVRPYDRKTAATSSASVFGVSCT